VTIKEMRELTDKATDGPWLATKDMNTPPVYQTAHITRDVWPIPRTTKDAEFIAASRTMVPELLDKLEKCEYLLGTLASIFQKQEYYSCSGIKKIEEYFGETPDERSESGEGTRSEPNSNQ